MRVNEIVTGASEHMCPFLFIYLFIVVSGSESSSQEAEERLQEVRAVQEKGRWGRVSVFVFFALTSFGATLMIRNDLIYILH